MRRRLVLLLSPFFLISRRAASSTSLHRRNKKIIVIMGPTGCGKSNLSLDLVSRFFPASEIINSDKMQVYRGLDITTNKLPLFHRRNIPHSLIGDFHSSREFTPSDFRAHASRAISRILSNRKLPFVVGGSNSFLYALLAKEFDPGHYVFADIDSPAVCKELRYRCCFIWIDASPAVLNRYLEKRVDDMLELGMYDELSRYFVSGEFSSSSSAAVPECGLRKAIGVPEFGKYFEKFPEGVEKGDEVGKRRAYGEAVQAIKDNTCQLAKRQVSKIHRLRDAAGWDLKRVDATDAIQAAIDGGGRPAAEIWKKQVLQPCVKIVNRFLME